MMREMTAEYACELLGVQVEDDFNTLQQNYRALLKKYHPDQYQEQIEFYNIMMGRINQAYQLLSAEFKHSYAQPAATDDASPNVAADTQPNSTTEAQAATEAKGYTTKHNADADTESAEALLRGSNPIRPRIIDLAYRPYIESAQEAIRQYYSYNLSNIHLRDAGSTRTHFRVVQNKFATLLKKFEQHIVRKQDYDTDSHYYFLFCKAFFSSIQSELHMHTSSNKTAYKLLKIYRDCTQILDSVIEQRYCNTNRASRIPPIENILLAQRNLNQLAREDEQFGLKDIAIIKYNLADILFKTLYWQYNTR